MKTLWATKASVIPGGFIDLEKIPLLRSTAQEFTALQTYLK